MRVDYTDADATVQALKDTDWGTAVQNNVIVSQFCPICYATVPVMSNGRQDYFAKGKHIEWHGWLAQVARTAFTDSTGPAQ